MTPPVFKETFDTFNTGIYLLDPVVPERVVTVTVEGQNPESLDTILQYEVIDNTEADAVEILISKTLTNTLDSYNLIICYSYGA